MPTIAGLFAPGSGGNLISWDIEPISTRQTFREIAVRYHDRKSGQIKTHKKATGKAGERAKAVNLVRSVARDEGHAKDIAEGRVTDIERNGGEGTVTLDLMPDAQAEALFSLSGTRSGVDGTYRIDSVTHTASRGSGAITRLSLKQPQDGAGEDKR
ncbi:MAG: hypothetical protein ABJQ71_05980 [Roseibium sp.]